VAVSPASGVRTAVPDDLAALRALAADSLHWDADAADLVDLLWPTAETEFALVSEADGAVVGLVFGSLGPEPRDPLAARRGHVNLLAVGPAARRQGHATARRTPSTSASPATGSTGGTGSGRWGPAANCASSASAACCCAAA